MSWHLQNEEDLAEEFLSLETVLYNYSSVCSEVLQGLSDEENL